jgi:hypothetical protein
MTSQPSRFPRCGIPHSADFAVPTLEIVVLQLTMAVMSVTQKLPWFHCTSRVAKTFQQLIHQTPAARRTSRAGSSLLWARDWQCSSSAVKRRRLHRRCLRKQQIPRANQFLSDWHIIVRVILLCSGDWCGGLRSHMQALESGVVVN